MTPDHSVCVWFQWLKPGRTPHSTRTGLPSGAAGRVGPCWPWIRPRSASCLQGWTLPPWCRPPRNTAPGPCWGSSPAGHQQRNKKSTCTLIVGNTRYKKTHIIEDLIKHAEKNSKLQKKQESRNALIVKFWADTDWRIFHTEDLFVSLAPKGAIVNKN